MKTIAIDARIIESSTGVYVQRLLHFLHQMKPDISFVVLVPSEHKEKWSSKLPNFTVVAADQSPYTFDEQLSLNTLLSDLKVDLVHFTMPQQPLLYRAPSVTTVHDTTLVRFDNVDMNPVVYKARKAVFTYLLRTVIRRSKQIITPTEFVKKDLVDYMHGKYGDKITVTLESGDPVDDVPEEISALVGKKFLFFVGNAFPYKNIGRTIDAFAQLKERHPDLHLVLAGKKDFFYEQLEKSVADKNISSVYFAGRISDNEKRWAYQHAVAFVTASLSEGFHIPLLEAMYEGCPVVASNATCIPEVAGDAALYFDPLSVDDIAAVTERMLTNPELREQQIKRGYEQVKKFSWERMAKQTLEVYKQALGE